MTRTPVGDCATLPAYREERVIDGAEGPVRLVLALDREGDRITHSEVLVRQAAANGWREQVLIEPAPARLLAGGDGPLVEIAERHEDKWIVAHGDRKTTDGVCVPLGGQTVWTRNGEARWQPHTDRDALRLLASRGLWRFAGDDGWMVFLAQAYESEIALLEPRRDRLQRRSAEPLMLLLSSSFPELNPGFSVVTTAPWSSEEAARAERKQSFRVMRAYVKRAWRAPNPCSNSG